MMVSSTDERDKVVAVSSCDSKGFHLVSVGSLPLFPVDFCCDAVPSCLWII